MSFQEAMHSLVQGIASSREGRAASLTALRDATAAQREAAQVMLNSMHSAHQAMAKRQWASLAKGRADLAQGEARRRSDVIDWVQDVASARQAMAKRQRASMAKGRADLFQREARRRSDIGAWMRKLAADHAGAAQEWRGMTATMRTQKAGAGAATDARPAAAPRPTAKVTALRDRVFDHLAGRPDGTRLTELEQEFKTSRFQMIKALRDLMNEDKVEKRGRLYIAI